MNYFDKKNIALFVIIGIVIVGVLLVLTKKSAIKEEINTFLQEITEQKSKEGNLDSIEKQTTTTPETKIYRNEEWGFEFEYPEDWTFYANTFGSTFSKFNLVGASPQESSFPNPIRPSILVNIVTPDFADRAVISRRNSGDLEIDFFVGKLRGKKFETTVPAPKISIDLPFGKFRMILAAYKEYEVVFNQIIATFKFVE